jgi:hypothetical protein
MVDKTEGCKFVAYFYLKMAVFWDVASCSLEDIGPNVSEDLTTSIIITLMVDAVKHRSVCIRLHG